VANTTPNVLGANPTISQTNNRFNIGQSYSYDLAGNVTAEPGNKGYTYDAENHQLSFTLTSATTTYGYDGDGRRVRKANPDGTTIVYVYNAMGQMVAEYTTGTASGTSGTSYITTDHLGSTRVVTKADGTVRARYDFLPFGEEIATNIGGRSGAGYVTDTTRQKFTGHERDSESGLDFAQARYCSSVTGRFMSPDAPFADQSEGDPQSWNLYTYVGNNPLNYTDPLGFWKQVHEKNGTYYLAEEDDELEDLAQILGVGLDVLEKAFGTEPVTVGHVYDLNFINVHRVLQRISSPSPIIRVEDDPNFRPSIIAVGMPKGGGFLSKIWSGIKSLFKSGPKVLTRDYLLSTVNDPKLRNFIEYLYSNGSDKNEMKK